MFGFDLEYKDGNDVYQLQLSRSLHITRCNPRGSIYYMNFLRCFSIIIMFITLVADYSMYEFWKPEGKPNDPDHVLWLLRGENQIALLFLAVQIIGVFSAIAAPSDGIIKIEHHPPPTIQMVHWFGEVMVIALGGAMFISFFAWVRINATEQSFAVGLQLVLFICLTLNILIGLHSLQPKAVVYPLGLATCMMVLMLLIQRNDVYVIYPQLKSSREGFLAILIFDAVILAWYLPVSFLLQFGKGFTWVKTETKEQQEHRKLQEGVEIARAGGDFNKIAEAEELLQKYKVDNNI